MYLAVESFKCNHIYNKKQRSNSNRLNLIINLYCKRITSLINLEFPITNSKMFARKVACDTLYSFALWYRNALVTMKYVLGEGWIMYQFTIGLCSFLH